MKTTNESAKELHERLLSMAKVLSNFLDENNIEYYMMGGTFLGAIRHRGFIPWDDDMDFGIMRDEYNRFIELAKSNLPKGYELKFYENTPESPMHYIKFIDANTTLIEEHYKDYVEGLYIDVFPIDGCGNNTIIDKITRKIIHYYQVLIIYHCSSDDMKGIKNIVKFFARKISIDKLHRRIEKLMTRKKVKDSSYVVNYLGAWGEREVHPIGEFGQPQKYHFEDTLFSGPEKSNEYLTRLYGDYNELPPENKRVFRHNYYYLNYDLPYKKYNNVKQ